jgi:transcription initiation protein SPT3
LAFEMVRSLTLAGLKVKRSLEEASLADHGSPGGWLKRKATGGNDIGPNKRRREDPDVDREDFTLPTCALFAAPPEARTSLQPEHIQDAFARMQNDWSHHRSAGMRNWRGGLIRTRVTLI